MKRYRSVWDLFICCNHLLLVIPLRYLMLICALPWLSALCCLVLLLCFLLPCNPSFLRLFCVFFFPPSCLSLSALGFDCKNQNPNCGAHKSASLNVLVAVDDLLSAPVPLLGLLWLVASLLGLGCVVWTEQFTPVWPSCRQVSFLWEVFQWNPRGERFFGGWPFPTSNVSSYYFRKYCLFSLLSDDCPQASKWSWILLSRMV